MWTGEVPRGTDVGGPQRTLSKQSAMSPRPDRDARVRAAGWRTKHIRELGLPYSPAAAILPSPISPGPTVFPTTAVSRVLGLDLISLRAA